jgi:hypothetical protein
MSVVTGCPDVELFPGFIATFFQEVLPCASCGDMTFLLDKIRHLEDALALA